MTALPEKGRADEAVVALLADRLGLSADAVRVARGSGHHHPPTPPYEGLSMLIAVQCPSARNGGAPQTHAHHRNRCSPHWKRQSWVSRTQGICTHTPLRDGRA